MMTDSQFRKRWLQGAPDYIADCYDGGERTLDRYMVFVLPAESSVDLVGYIALDKATQPQGLFGWGELTKTEFAAYQRAGERYRVRWLDLPDAVRKGVRTRIEQL
jgi:hypothetical protein